MATLPGTVTAASLYRTPSGERLTIELDVPCGATEVALTASEGRPTPSDPRVPTNAVGRTISIAVDDVTKQITAISIT